MASSVRVLGGQGLSSLDETLSCRGVVPISSSLVRHKDGVPVIGDPGVTPGDQRQVPDGVSPCPSGRDRRSVSQQEHALPGGRQLDVGDCKPVETRLTINWLGLSAGPVSGCDARCEVVYVLDCCRYSA
jgi:hypothetical protein